MANFISNWENLTVMLPVSWTIERIPHLDTCETYATLYAPLEKTPFTPQVIVIVTTPRNMLKLAQSSLFRIGGRIWAEFSGIQSVCADVTAQTYLSGPAEFLAGLRRFTQVLGYR